MLLPFYSEDLGSWRYLGASFAALAFIVFLFWHLNLHYMNLLFAALGYRVFTVYPPADGNPLTGKIRHAVITRRVSLASGERLVAYRLSERCIWRRRHEAGLRHRERNGYRVRRRAGRRQRADLRRGAGGCGRPGALREMVQATWDAMQRDKDGPAKYEPSEKHGSTEYLYLPLGR